MNITTDFVQNLTEEEIARRNLDRSEIMEKWLTASREKFMFAGGELRDMSPASARTYVYKTLKYDAETGVMEPIQFNHYGVTRSLCQFSKRAERSQDQIKYGWRQYSVAILALLLARGQFYEAKEYGFRDGNKKNTKLSNIFVLEKPELDLEKSYAKFLESRRVGVTRIDL